MKKCLSMLNLRNVDCRKWSCYVACCEKQGLQIFSLHKFTHVYIYCSENCGSIFDIKCFHLFTHIHNGIVKTVGLNCT